MHNGSLLRIIQHPPTSGLDIDCYMQKLEILSTASQPANGCHDTGGPLPTLGIITTEALEMRRHFSEEVMKMARGKLSLHRNHFLF